MQSVSSTSSAGNKRKACSASSASSSATMPRKAMGMMGAPEADLPDEPVVPGRMPKIRVGNRSLTMHSELVEMTDSTTLFQDGRFDLLRARLEQDGFLFVRGVMPQAVVAKARTRMLAHLRDKGAIREGTEWTGALIEYQAAWDAKNKTGAKKGKKTTTAAASTSSTSKKMIPGWTVDAESGGLVGSREPDSAVAGWHAVGNSRDLTDVYDGPALRSFYQRLFACDAEYASRPHLEQQGLPSYSTLPSCTWLRAKGPGEVTAEHADYYYFAKNTHIFRDFWRQEDIDAVQPAAKTTTAAATKRKCQSEEERETCQVCNDTRSPETTLICDLCEHGFHMDCLSPRVTQMPEEEQEWHCHACSNLALPYWTCWTALGEIGGHDGRLALVPGSHRLGGYDAAVREDLLPAEYTKKFEQASVWQTPTNIGMGDIILFNIKTIHAATKNAGEKFRLSLDTRVTTSKGKQYLENHGLTSLDTPLPPAAVAKKKSAAVGGKLAANEGTIASFFPAQKKQKIVESMA